LIAFETDKHLST